MQNIMMLNNSTLLIKLFLFYRNQRTLPWHSRTLSSTGPRYTHVYIKFVVPETGPKIVQCPCSARGPMYLFPNTPPFAFSFLRKHTGDGCAPASSSSSGSEAKAASSRAGPSATPSSRSARSSYQGTRTSPRRTSTRGNLRLCAWVSYNNSVSVKEAHMSNLRWWRHCMKALIYYPGFFQVQWFDLRVDVQERGFYPPLAIRIALEGLDDVSQIAELCCILQLVGY